MNNGSNHASFPKGSPGSTLPPCRPRTDAVSRGEWLRTARWLSPLTAGAFWLLLIYALPLHTLRESRRIARDELVRLLQTKQPDTPAILDSFDRATEMILFSAVGPYFLLGVATMLLAAHLITLRRKLEAAERNIQVLRDVVLGVDGVSLR